MGVLYIVDEGYPLNSPGQDRRISERELFSSSVQSQGGASIGRTKEALVPTGPKTILKSCWSRICYTSLVYRWSNVYVNLFIIMFM